MDAWTPGARPELPVIVAALGALVSPPAEATDASGRRRRSAVEAVASEAQADAGAPIARRRSKAPRAAGLALEPIAPVLRNPWKPVEVLSEEQVERVIAPATASWPKAGWRSGGRPRAISTASMARWSTTRR